MAPVRMVLRIGPLGWFYNRQTRLGRNVLNQFRGWFPTIPLMTRRSNHQDDPNQVRVLWHGTNWHLRGIKKPGSTPSVKAPFASKGVSVLHAPLLTSQVCEANTSFRRSEAGPLQVWASICAAQCKLPCFFRHAVPPAPGNMSRPAAAAFCQQVKLHPVCLCMCHNSSSLLLIDSLRTSDNAISAAGAVSVADTFSNTVLMNLSSLGYCVCKSSSGRASPAPDACTNQSHHELARHGAHNTTRARSTCGPWTVRIALE